MSVQSQQENKLGYQVPTDGIMEQIDGLIIIARGDTVPGTVAGYAVGCIFVDTDAGVGATMYVNEGSITVADFNAVGASSATIVSDLSPQLGGELDANEFTIGIELQTLTGDGTDAIDWGVGNLMNFTFGAANETFTFTAPANPAVLYMSLLQDSVGTRLATWPAAVLWAGGTAPTLTTTGTTGRDLLKFVYDGTNYIGSVETAAVA